MEQLGIPEDILQDVATQLQELGPDNLQGEWEGGLQEGGRGEGWLDGCWDSRRRALRCPQRFAITSDSLLCVGVVGCVPVITSHHPGSSDA